MPAQLLSIDKTQYAMLDMHGEHICFMHIDDARQLLVRGLAKTFGSKKRIHGIKLLVELCEADVPDVEDKRTTIAAGKAMTAANYAGCRFVFKSQVSNGHGYVVVYRLKELEITESPEHALLRILTPPALESNVHTLRFDATDQERAADPGQERRKRTRDIFRMTHALRFRSRSQETPRPSGKAKVIPFPSIARPQVDTLPDAA